MNPELAGKAALITAGATGIGFGIAQALAAEGVDLAIGSQDLDSENLERLRAAGVKVEAMRCDVSQEDQAIRMVENAISALGKVDLYVNNAAWSWHRPITKLDTDSLLKTLQTNLFACIWACREISKHMIQRRSGSILIIGSTAMLNPLYQESAYRVSKASLPYFAEVLAIELAPYGIRVNSIIPGFHLTKLTQAGMTEASLKRIIREVPLRRPGLPVDIGAQAVVLLSDKLSGYTTGASVVIDGGLHLRPLPFYSDEELVALNLSE